MEYVDFMDLFDLYDYMLWIKALHVVGVILWMVGLFYLPRLYRYHAREQAGSSASETFKVMERRLLRAIMNPALGIVLVTGLLLWGQFLLDGWFHIKLLMVAGMLVAHGVYARWRKNFEADRNTHSAVFYRVWGEVPTLMMLVIVTVVIVKPTF
ncbi:protoporphyrinogen oxidase HemJ [Roseospira visakhapatnamensis]|uniref:Protoporphyrinogen IX oxidase n=1 Tax=Roseospira visakhapatnamensis TaxID=390880 RepID=A0A7W6RAU6_9PROT|nr:protoporphyrinogen oxidase HemJ [Roseospira visakhapatnamensis]MBB4264524.1 putative membrane protein [Roseospira visakhapatnamensis]